MLATVRPSWLLFGRGAMSIEARRASRPRGRVLAVSRGEGVALAAAVGARERDASVVVDAAVRHAVIRIAAQSIGLVLFGRSGVGRRPESQDGERRHGRLRRESGQVHRPRRPEPTCPGSSLLAPCSREIIPCSPAQGIFADALEINGVFDANFDVLARKARNSLLFSLLAGNLPARSRLRSRGCRAKAGTDFPCASDTL